MGCFFSMNPTSADYRHKAKENCRKHKSILTNIYLVYIAIIIVVIVIDNFTAISTTLPNGTKVTISWVEGIFSLLTSGAFALSFAEINKGVSFDYAVTGDELFVGFYDFKRSVAINMLKSLFTFLWSLLFVIPGIIKLYSYSMAYYIAYDNKGLSARECIDRSRKMMDGYKWEYFCLMFSYIGFILLSILIFGLLYFIILPINIASYLSILTICIICILLLPRINQASYLFYLKTPIFKKKF